MTTVEVKGVSVALDGRPVLTDLRLVIAGGSRLGLIGPNGSGKTTLLRAIAGLIPYKGEIRVGDAAGGGLSRRELARRIAMVPQSPVVPAGITVTEYVLLGRTPYIPTFGTESRRDLAIVASVLDHLDLTGLATRRLDSISGGERQRAVLARALAQQAPVLLLDEPTTGLDVGHQQQVLELVDTLRDHLDLTVVSAMHDLTLAGQFADQLVLLDGGRVAAAGPPATVLTEEVIRRHYHASVRVLEDPGGGEAGGNVNQESSRDPELCQPPVDPPERPARHSAPSLVLVNTGDGKGKSTAAFGTALRAVARGWKVCVIQFLKSGRWRTGEEEIGRRLGIDWNPLGDGFTWDSDDLEATRARAVGAWAAARRVLEGGDYQLVVLDEITYPMNWGWIDSAEVAGAIRDRPPAVNVVATGRDAPAELVEVADTVTEMRKVRHAYDRGVTARRGIDY
jgi:iron complex transport system ATP-binding protein